MRTVQVMIFLGIVTMSVAGQNSGKASALFGQMCDQFIKESLALQPEAASEAGYHRHVDKDGKTIELDAQLDDFSPGGYAARAQFYRHWRGQFEKRTPLAQLAPPDAVDYQLIDDHISLQLLELEQIQDARHNPTGVVETIGNALFLPLTQEYAPKGTRVQHVISRMKQIPRAVLQAKQLLLDADPIFIKVAREENEGNVELIQTVVKAQVPADAESQAAFAAASTQAISALNDLNAWMNDELSKRPTKRSWRLDKKLYDLKFKYYLETSATPEQVLADAEAQLKQQRAEMFDIANGLHQEWFPTHNNHAELKGAARENTVIREVLDRIADDHAKRDELLPAVEKDLEGIKKFIREMRIVDLGSRDNLKVIPTPVFMRGIYSVAGFHSAPPLEPTAEAQYWVTPIAASTSNERAESKLREYNNFTLKWLTIHEALPGHYVQAEHANNVQPESRRLLRNLFGNGATVEGWAEYIADVMVNQGYLDHDARWVLSRKKIWLRAVANSILDVRLHTMKMTDQQALDLMTQQCFQTQAEAEGKLQRAKLSSVQLPSYFVGSREWWAFRKRYQAAHKKFSLYDFHNSVLDVGPLPVASIEKLVK